MSLADFQAAQFSNGSFVKPVANREPSPPPSAPRSVTNQQLTGKTGDDLFESSQREAKKMLAAEKKQEDLKKVSGGSAGSIQKVGWGANDLAQQNNRWSFFDWRREWG